MPTHRRSNDADAIGAKRIARRRPRSFARTEVLLVCTVCEEAGSKLPLPCGFVSLFHTQHAMASKCERNGNGRFVLRDVCSPGGRGGEVSELAFSADGNHILMGTKSFAVRVWGTNSGEVELFAPPLVGSTG